MRATYPSWSIGVRYVAPALRPEAEARPATTQVSAVTEAELARLKVEYATTQRTWCARLFRRLRWFLWNTDLCPRCETYTLWSTELVNLFHPDRPPNFRISKCRSCGLELAGL